MVIAPAHHRRVAAGILSWGQDMDAETLPFQVNLGYQVPRTKEADYIGKAALEQARDQVEAGTPPYTLTWSACGWAASRSTSTPPTSGCPADADGDPVGYLTSPWWSPELESNIALGYVPVGAVHAGHRARGRPARPVRRAPGRPGGADVVEVPFRPSVNPNQRELLKQKGLDAAV